MVPFVGAEYIIEVNTMNKEYLKDRYYKTILFYAQIKVWRIFRNKTNEQIEKILRRDYMKELVEYVPSLGCVATNIEKYGYYSLRKISRLNLVWDIYGNAYNNYDFSSEYNIEEILKHCYKCYTYDDYKEALIHYWSIIYDICDTLGYEYVPYTEVTEWIDAYNIIEYNIRSKIFTVKNQLACNKVYKCFW